MNDRPTRRSLSRRLALASVGLTALVVGFTAQPASAHQKTCELPWDPSQWATYTVCVAEAQVHNSVWHLIFP